MTRKDYELIASKFDIKWMNEHYPHYKSDRTALRKSYDTSLNSSIQTARRMADAFKLDNPAFNRLKFLEACGLDDDQLKYYGEK